MNPYAPSNVPVSPIVGHASPYMQSASYGQPATTTPYPQTTPQQAATIQPGSITYTTTVGPDGQVVYHPFKAVAASYQTAAGVVNGIQWIPAEATSVLPANATPADADAQNFAASFSRRGGDDRWRDDDYRRRKDDASRGSNRDRYDDDDEYYRRQREREDRDRDDRDYRRGPRDRDDRKGSGAYGRYPGEYDKYAAADLERRMAELDLERREKDRERERERERDRDYDRERTARPRKGSFYAAERPTSTYQPAPGGHYPTEYSNTNSTNYTAAPGGNYPVSAGYHPPSPRPGQARPLSTYGNSVPRPASPYAAPIAPRPVSPYAAGGAIPRAASPYQPGGIQRAASPYGGGGAMHRAASPYSVPGGLPPRAASPYGAPPAGSIYPTGHVLEGQYRPSSRAPSPSPYGAAPVNVYANPNTVGGAYGAQAPYGSNPYGASGIGAHASPRVGAVPLDPTQQQAMLTVPEGFSRPPNRAQPYTQFEMLKVGDMDELLEHMPRMPAVLVPHDVYHEDWIRLMTDLGMAWAGTMPVPQYSADGRPPKRATLTADVVDLWNASFFRARGVEVVLYKGRERRSGRLAGTVDMYLPGFDAADVSSPSEDEDEDEDDDRDPRYPGRYGGAYGRGEPDPRKRREKAERKQRKMEKKVKRRQKELERTYALYLQCVPPSEQ